MKLVIQRVRSASVSIEGETTRGIGPGFVVLLGVGNEDNETDVVWLVKKLIALRVFNDENGLMNNNLKQMKGEILLISQFTLMASTRKGNRPSYTRAAKPSEAEPLYENFKKYLCQELGREIVTGTFGADMSVSLTNDGPVTIIIDSKARD